MDFREILGVLSKSSPYAVTTAGEIIDPELRAIKDNLYIETDVELAFKNKIENISTNNIIFLCGSSGDGKSEILSRYSKLYEGKIDFHFDATHSFNPEATAIETLDEVMSKWKQQEKPLVVGINIGMLANYERDGASEHNDIKLAINRFLSDRTSGPVFIFIDFESYPKFKFESGRISSPFFSSLINKVVVDDQKNGFKKYFEEEYGKSRTADNKLVANYLLLRNVSIQKVIIELLLNARIREDQFVTARMLLDFLYCILTGPDYLFDNLFNGGDNELLEAIAKFDPAIKRDSDIDKFILNRALDISDGEFIEFRNELKNKFKITGLLNPASEVRLMYVLRYTSLNNNYPMKFINSFKDYAELLYRELWELHRIYQDTSDHRKKIKTFYDDIVFSAIDGFANRNAPYLSKDQFYLSSHGEYDIASEIELEVCYESLTEHDSNNIHSFNLHIKANEERLDPIPLNINLLALMLEVVSGYRPNVHDKSSVVILGDLVAKITSRASEADQLFLFKNGNRLARVKKNSTGNIKVSG